MSKERDFKIGDVLEINGRLRQGRAIVKMYLSKEERKSIKGEISYSWKCSEPFPQMVCEFENGGMIHYNANDIYDTEKIKYSDNKTWGSPIEKTVEEFIKSFKFIYPTLSEEAYGDKIIEPKDYSDGYLNEDLFLTNLIPEQILKSVCRCIYNDSFITNEEQYEIELEAASCECCVDFSEHVFKFENKSQNTNLNIFSFKENVNGLFEIEIQLNSKILINSGKL